jgi:hypothetical protein
MAPSGIDHNTATETEIVAFCKNSPRIAPRVVKLSDTAVAKFGVGVREEEANNQRRAYELLNPNTVRIPYIYRFFRHSTTIPAFRVEGMKPFPECITTEGYIIMEYVQGYVAEPDQYLNLVGKLLPVLQSLAKIKSEIPGPLNGGISRGMFWDDDYPEFRTKKDLEDWVNRRLRGQSPNVCFNHTPLVLCHMDLVPRNILCLPNGSICLLDWESAGFYPLELEIAMLAINSVHKYRDRFNDPILKGISTSAQTSQVERAWSNSQKYFLYVYTGNSMSYTEQYSEPTEISNQPWSLMTSPRDKKVLHP